MAIKYHYEKIIKETLRDQIASSLKPNVMFGIDRIHEVDGKFKIYVLIETLGNSPTYNYIGTDRLISNELTLSVEIVVKGNDEMLIKDKLEEYKYIVYDALFSTKDRKQLGGKVDKMNMGQSTNFDDDDGDASIIGVSTNLIIYYKQKESDFSTNV